MRANCLRREAIGMDRDSRTYWMFTGDPGLLFIQAGKLSEMCDRVLTAANDGPWGYYALPEEIEQLCAWLNAKV